MVITDLALEQIRNDIALEDPERGGALYGPRSFPLITHFEYDHDGLTSSTTYVPSSRLIANVPRIERETGLHFKGIVHSHPLGFTRPSGGDAKTVSSFFRLNPHFSTIALPIVQCHQGDEQFIHWYRAERSESSPDRMGWNPFLKASEAAHTNTGVEIFEEEFYVLPAVRHLQFIIERVSERGVILTTDRIIQPLRLKNAELVGVIAQSDSGHELMYFMSIDYPVVSPLVLCRAGGRTEQLRFVWNGIDEPENNLLSVVSSLTQLWLGTTESPDAHFVEATEKVLPDTDKTEPKTSSN